MIIIQILITLIGIYLYISMGQFTLGLMDDGGDDIWDIFVFILWPIFIVIYMLFICLEKMEFIIKPLIFMRWLGHKLNTYFESKNEKKGE